MAAWWARPAADKGRPGDQARPRGLKPRAAAAAAARRVPSCWQRSSRAAGDRLLSGAGDQAGGCSGLQGGEPRGGAGWHLHLGPSQPVRSIYPVHYLASTPRRDALHRSSSTRCVIRLRLPHLCPALRAAHVLAPTGSIPAGLHARRPLRDRPRQTTTTGQTMTNQEAAFTSTRTSDGTLLDGRHSDPVQVTAGVRGHRREETAADVQRPARKDRKTERRKDEKEISHKPDSD